VQKKLTSELGQLMELSCVRWACSWCSRVDPRRQRLTMKNAFPWNFFPAMNNGSSADERKENRYALKSLYCRLSPRLLLRAPDKSRSVGSSRALPPSGCGHFRIKEHHRFTSRSPRWLADIYPQTRIKTKLNLFTKLIASSFGESQMFRQFP
jgi:hypothetical protein